MLKISQMFMIVCLLLFKFADGINMILYSVSTVFERTVCWYIAGHRLKQYHPNNNPCFVAFLNKH